MAEINERVEVEFENIQQVLSKLPQENTNQILSTLEIAGIAALIHNFYNGIENILKQIVRNSKLNFPTGPSWHRDLLQLSVDSKIISVEISGMLKPYLGFRNFFVHGYAFQLEREKLQPLLNQTHALFTLFKKEILTYLATL